MIAIRKFHDLVIEPPRRGIKIAGYYKLTKGIEDGYIDANTGLWVPRGDIITAEIPWFGNIITNNGLDLLATEGSNAATEYSHVGTGTGAEAATDTNLGTFVNSTNTIEDNTTGAESSAPYYGYRRKTLRHGQGDAEGVIAEVGMSTQNTNGGLFSRARIVDGGGSPTTISVLSTEWLDVTYELRCYPDHINNTTGATDDGTGSVSFSGTSYNYTIRPAYITDASYWFQSHLEPVYYSLPAGNAYGRAFGSDGALGAVTSQPTGTSQANAYTNTGISAAGYSSGTYNRDITMSIGLGDCNVTGGIKAFRFNTRLGTYQILFDTPLPKDNTKTMTLVNNLAWTRATIP